MNRGEPKPKPAPAALEGAGEGDGEGDGGEGEGDGQGDGGEGAGDGEGEGEGDQRSIPESQRINNLTKRLRQSERAREADKRDFEARLAAIEKGGLPNQNGGGNSGAEETPAPDPTDATKYPLGHLDDRYIEDRTDWLATKKATEIADRILHRQQETANAAAAQEAQTALLGKIDDLATRGEALEDFQEIVVDAGLKGDWPLTQTTFEAAHEAEHGAEILYALAKNPTEARRVHDLSPLAQLRYVETKNAEIAATKAGRRKPQAGAPPAIQPKGANSRTVIDPATDDLDQFEKLWEADAKGSRR